MIQLKQLVIVLSSTGLLVNAATFSAKGCYALSDLQSVLSSQGDYTYQTNSYCEGLCSDSAVAATLGGSTCYCGDKLPSNIEAVDSSKCNVDCQGYPSEICGGSGFLSVYTTGTEDTSANDDDDDNNDKSTSASNSQTTSASKTSTSASASTTTSSSSSKSSSSTTAASTTTSSSSSSSSASTRAASSSTTASSSTSSNQSSASGSSSRGASTSVQIITSIVSASNSASTATETISATASSSSGTNTSSSSSSPSSSSSSDSGSSQGLSKGAIAGIAVGSIVGIGALVGVIVGIYCFTRRARNDDDDELSNHFDAEKPPIHNDFNSLYDRQATNIFANPTPFFAEDNGHKRLSNGSLPDARHEKTLRVTNPDDTVMNDTTLNQTHESDVESDDSDWRA